PAGSSPDSTAASIWLLSCWKGGRAPSGSMPGRKWVGSVLTPGSPPHRRGVRHLGRGRARQPRPATGETRRRRRPRVAADVDERLTSHHVFVLERLRVAQDRGGAGVGVLEDRRPLVAGAGEEPVRDRLAELLPPVDVEL